jgi:microcystin-dependent protein
LCNGQLLPINQNQALFSLLGTTYGGDGRVNFALPNLQGRAPIHVGAGHTLGEPGGEQGHTLSLGELPTHVHTLNGSTTQASTNVPASNTVLSASNPQNVYGQASNPAAMGSSAIENVGGSQAHPNMQPFLALTFAIALQGIFPSRN